MKALRNKKGSGIDNLWVAVVFFSLAIFFLVLMVMWNAFSTEMDDVWTGSSKGPIIKNNAQNAVNQFDWIMVVVWVGLHLGILGTAYLLKTHPIIYVVSLLLIGLLALITAPLANAWDEMTDEPELSSAADSFPKLNYILENYPKLEIIWAIVTVIVMFALARNQGFL